MTTRPLRSVHATLRVDADHVVLDTDNGQLVLTAEVPSPLWSWAQGAPVDAKLREASESGGPPHIDSLRVKGEGSFAYREVGVIESMRGTVVVEIGAPGTKLEGNRTPYFVADTGQRYGLVGGEQPSARTPTKVHVRRLIADMSFAARDTDADVYFVP